MRIGIVLDNEFDNDHRVQKQIKQLVAAGHTLTVLCFDFGNKYNVYSDFEVIRIPLNQNLKNILVLLSTRFSFYENLWIRHIAKLITNYNIEALHSHDLYLSKASRKGIQKSKSKVLLTLDLHENYPAAINSYQWAVKGWRKWIVNPNRWYSKEFEYLNYADCIVTLSNWFKKDLISRFPKLDTKKFATHPNLPDFESFQLFEKKLNPIDFKSNIPTLFYFGVVAKRRGIIDILPWLEELLAEGLKFHLLVIGPLDKADSKDFKLNLDLPNLKAHSTYLPWADISLLPSYLKAISIGLAPFRVNAQHDSGVANKLYQYMYGRIPILATACKAQKELLENTNCGLVYTNYESFKTQLRKLVQDTELQNTLGNNGKKELLRLYKSGADQEFLSFYKK